MNAGGYLTVNAVGSGNNGATITGSTVNGKAASGADFTASDDFTMIFDLQLNGGNDQASWFHINDASNSNGGNEAVGTHMLTLNQTAANGTTWQINGSAKTVTLSKSTWYTFKLTKSSSNLFLTVTPTAGGDPVFERQTITVNSTTGGLGNMIFQTKRYYAFMAIDNVVLREKTSDDVPAGTPTSWTIKYRNESDEEIKSDVVTDGLVDDEVTASAAQMAAITYEGQKYLYKSGNTEITLVETAAANVITLVYRAAAKYNYSITSSYNGNTLPWSVSGSCWEDENKIYVRYPRYQAYETKLVGKAPISNALEVAIDVTNDGFTQDLVYTKTADNLLYWCEAENMGTGLSTSATSFTNRVSNELIVYGSSGKIATLLPGTYQVALGVIGHANSGDAATVTYKIKAGDADKKTFQCTGNTLVLGVTDEFTLTEVTDITFTCDYPANSRGVDFAYITGTIDDISANTDVTSLIKNPDVEEDASNGAWQQTVKGWYDADNAVNYRPLAVSGVTNPTGAFTNTYAYENWTSDAAGLKGQIKQSIGGLPNGVYKLQLAALVRTVNNQFIYGKSNGKTYKTSLSGANSQANDYSVIVVVEDNQLEIGLDMNNSGADWGAIDNARLTYMPTVPLAISAAGWATLYTPYALDFSSLSGSFTAYTASLSESTVTLNEVSNVPANTGVVLSGAEGNYNIPVITSSATEKGDLTGNATSDTDYDAFTGIDLYMLALNGGDAQFTLVNSGSIAAGKAFLKVEKGVVTVKAFSVVLNDTATGIRSMDNGQLTMDNGQIFNLAGQRLNKMQKGINIVNGKKVIK